MFSPYALASSGTQILPASLPIVGEDVDRNVNHYRTGALLQPPPHHHGGALPAPAVSTLCPSPAQQHFIVDSRRNSIISECSSDVSTGVPDRNKPMPSSMLNAMKVYMRNLPGCISEEDVQRFAEGYGSIRKIEMGRERGGTTHCCYVTFDSAVAATECARTANGTVYFVQIAGERGYTGALPPATVRMAESLEERKERLARKDHGPGISSSGLQTQSNLPPPPPYVQPSFVPPPTPSVSMPHPHPQPQPQHPQFPLHAVTAPSAITLQPSTITMQPPSSHLAPVPSAPTQIVYIIIPQS